MIYEKIFDFGDSESFSNRYEEAGIEGSVFIPAIGPVFIFVVFYPLATLTHLCARYIFNGRSKIKWINNYVQQKNYLINFITFLLEGAIELGMSVAICLLMVSLNHFSATLELILTQIRLLWHVIRSTKTESQTPLRSSQQSLRTSSAWLS